MWRTEVAHLLPAVVVCGAGGVGYLLPRGARGSAVGDVASWHRTRCGFGARVRLTSKHDWPEMEKAICYLGMLLGERSVGRIPRGARAPLRSLSIARCRHPSSLWSSVHLYRGRPCSPPRCERGGWGTTWSFVFAFSVGIDCSTLPPLGPSPVPPRPLLALPSGSGKVKRKECYRT
ncbi:hypothetical protein B296_00001412 [Ensete ventricosum]|uniref:Uncharacterized protein n=1 Tax=Ensete ventricosum TaxID=4639 RepID=A0A427AMS7_ENSVE|nr:hypothetical protein B296_00001412 [Ensete ventricosum]